MNSESKLIDDYLDGELNDAAHGNLTAWLHQRNDHVREFAISSLIHSLLSDYLSQRHVQADALLRAMTTRSVDGSAQQISSGNGQAPTPTATELPFATPADDARGSADVGVQRRRRWRTHAAVLTIVLVIAASAVSFFALRPSVVAMLTQTAGCRWETTDDTIGDGTLFREGEELKLMEGRALVTFVSGAKVILEGPAVLTVESKSSARLTRGTITAAVPGQAVGFKVGLPIGELVDLGTEFTARMQSDGAFELQVFDGLVELTVNGGGDKVDPAPLRLSEGVAVKFDPVTGKVEAIDYQPEEQMRMPSGAGW